LKPLVLSVLTANVMSAPTAMTKMLVPMPMVLKLSLVGECRTSTPVAPEEYDISHDRNWGCRKQLAPCDGWVVSEVFVDVPDQRRVLVALYDSALPEVYGYLASRCGSASVAEDLTSETFLAAVDAVRRETVPDLTVAWLIGVARHKLVDHWRRREREERKLQALDPHPGDAGKTEDPWDVQLDAMVAHRTLADLAPQHRSALTLRYLDGLPVREVASCLGRTEGATEVLLVRAKAAFRAHYGEEER
jgi:RNA polymerase sigma-70 factor (ECF subfamily)